MPMNSSTRTLPGAHTRPRSLRPRSTSITCSARSSSSARTGDGARLDVVALHGDQRLRARATEGEVVEGDVVQVGARVHGSQPTVDRERRYVDRGAEALAEDDLEGVAGVDVV